MMHKETKEKVVKRDITLLICLDFLLHKNVFGRFSVVNDNPLLISKTGDVNDIFINVKIRSIYLLKI